MKAVDFQDLVTLEILPFIEENFENGHKLIMDNARTHSAQTTRRYLNNLGISHFETPAQSPVILDNLFNLLNL